MFFVLSKIFWAVFAPMTFISLMIVGGWLTCKYRWGQRVLACGVFLLVFLAMLPVGHNVCVYWENKYPPIKEMPNHVDGIIVLGGSIDFKKSFIRGQSHLNVHSPRITEMMILSQRYPKAKILLSGGNGSLEKSSSSEAIELNKLLKNINFYSPQISYEGESRNTFENMEFSKNMMNPKNNEVWLLVTSAFHMKRSEAIFKSNGWNVIPYPAGYLTDGEYKVIPNFEVIDNMYKFQIVAREIIGIIAYRLTGKIKS